MKKNKYMIIIIVGVVLWISETAYFGWNAKPESAGESVLDFIAGVMIGWGIIGDLISNVTIIKRYSTVNNINTKTVELNNPKVNVGKKSK